MRKMSLKITQNKCAWPWTTFFPSAKLSALNYLGNIQRPVLSILNWKILFCSKIAEMYCTNTHRWDLKPNLRHLVHWKMKTGKQFGAFAVQPALFVPFDNWTKHSSTTLCADNRTGHVITSRRSLCMCHNIVILLMTTFLQNIQRINR